MRVKGILLTALALGFTAAALAATTVTLTDTSQTTTLTANVAEQATVTVPAGVTFTVNNVTTSTVATNATVTVIDIVLNDGKKLKISLQANTRAHGAGGRHRHLGGGRRQLERRDVEQQRGRHGHLAEQCGV